jgi:hypothetical protein
MIMRTHALGPFALLTALALAACTHMTPLRAAAPGVPVSQAAQVQGGSTAGCEGDSRCSHPIDRFVLPRMKTPPAAPDTNELCRRLAIDVLGRGPTENEVASCTKRPIGETVDAWLASPEHDRVVRRAWADLTQYDGVRTWYPHLVDLDALVGRMARGEIGYGEMATRFVVHPAFYARHPGDDWIRAMYNIFLGRTARPDEVDSLSALVTVWSARQFIDAAVIKSHPDYGGYVSEVGISFCRCDSSPFGCSSNALGKPVDFGAPQKAGSCEEDGRLATSRLVAMPSGGRTICASTKPNAHCMDVDGEGKRIAPLAETTPDELKRMRSLGDALVARGDFWEAAVDREMRRYLGWWQSAFKRPDSDLPDVRSALATELAKTGDVRALERTILTSVLYTMPARGEADAPPWTSGPRKLLAAEPWLDTVGGVIGERLGSCDHRFASQVVAVEAYVDPTVLKGTLEKSSLVDQKKVFDYGAAARTIGGCSSEHRPHIPSMGLAQAERELAAKVCGAGRGVFIGKGRETNEQIARRLASRAFARPVQDAEARELAADMDACLSAGAAVPQRRGQKRVDRPGCINQEAAARWMCTRLVTSAEFGTY